MGYVAGSYCLSDFGHIMNLSKLISNKILNVKLKIIKMLYSNINY